MFYLCLYPKGEISRSGGRWGKQPTEVFREIWTNKKKHDTQLVPYLGKTEHFLCFKILLVEEVQLEQMFSIASSSGTSKSLFLRLKLSHRLPDRSTSMHNACLALLCLSSNLDLCQCMKHLLLRFALQQFLVLLRKRLWNHQPLCNLLLEEEKHLLLIYTLGHAPST